MANRSDRERIDVRVLCMDGCEATPRAVELVRDVATALGVRIRLQRVTVGNEAEAAERRFLGSPTVQVNGLDVEVGARSSQAFGLT